MATRMEKYGLDRYIGSGFVKPGDAEERIRLLDQAWKDCLAETGDLVPLDTLYSWLREEIA